MFLMKMRDMRGSIIRQSMMLSFIVFPAYVVNFLFLIVSGRILGPQAFGIFYTAMSFVSILIGPAVILNLFFARRITLSSVSHGIDGAIAEFRLFVRYVLRWGGLLGLNILVAMMILAYFLNVESTTLVIVISISVYAIYITETTRTAFQGLRRFVALGIETLSWTIVRFILGIAGLVLVGSAWAGLLGIAIAAVIIFLASYYILVKQFSNKPLPLPKRTSQENRRMLSFCFSYGLLIFITYLDNIIAYIGLDRSDLGIYSSACVVGKSIVLFTNPIVQVFFPIMVEQNNRNGIEMTAVLKTFAITVLMSGIAAGIVVLFADFIGTNILGLTEFNVSIIKAVAASAVPLCLLRILILLQLSKGLDKYALLLLPIVLLQMMVLYFFSDDPVQFSWCFVLSCWTAFCYYGVLCIPNKMVDSILRMRLLNG